MKLAEAVAASPWRSAISTHLTLAAYYVSAYGTDCLGVCLLPNYQGEDILCGSAGIRGGNFPIPDHIRTHAHLPLTQLPDDVRANIESDDSWEPAQEPHAKLEDWR